jgi:4-amino-4-deoxy-L-arabinose transferase-like glycosyltransferase
VSAAPTLSPEGAREQLPGSGLAGRLTGSGGPLTSRWRHTLALIPFALSLLFNTVNLSQNGFANTFYSAGVRSMLVSLHNFFFVSFDTGGLITVDKPPLALWLQATSAKIFGFHPLSLLLPEAIVGALTVLVVYAMLARRLGLLAGLAGATALAVYPTIVAVSRDNGVDPLLILMMALACATAVRACETGRWRSLLACAAFVGLAFNTKTLAAFLVVPGIAAAYLLCAPGTPRARIARLLVAGAVMLAVSFAWILAVELTPSSKRPFVGSSKYNTEVGLTLEYNGVGRVEGQQGGPGSITARPGAFVPSAQLEHNPPGAFAANRQDTGTLLGELPAQDRPAPVSTSGPKRLKLPIPFGEAPSPVRLFGVGLGEQVGWLLPLSVFGLLGIGLLLLGEHRPRWRVRPASAQAVAEPQAPPPPPAPGPPRPSPSATAVADRHWRRDPRLALLVVLGGWFVVEAVVLSFSKGIVHPYYVSALAPSAAAVAGAGVVALARAATQGPRRWWALSLATGGIASTVLCEVVLMHREHYAVRVVPVLAVLAALAVALAIVALLLQRQRLAWLGLLGAFALLLVLPARYASSTWLAPVEGTFPVAGPTELAGHGGAGLNERDLAIYRALMRYTQSHKPGTRWELLTVAADTASHFIIMGEKAGALGGYSGMDPAVSGARMASFVARGEARYVLLGGEYGRRGGNGAIRAVLANCEQLTSSVWGSPVGYPFGLVLFDCAGREKQLASAGSNPH